MMNRRHAVYSRTSVPQTLTAGLLRLFRTRSFVPNKNPIAADIIVFGINAGALVLVLILIIVCLCTH